MIDRITARFDAAPVGEIGVGDDAAVITSPAGYILLTTDVLVEGVDFELDWCTGTDLGWKAIAVNVSDIAAMGGTPSHALATLMVEPSTPVSLVDGIIDGMGGGAEHWGLSLSGGDISRADKLAVSIALMGRVEEPILRSTARPGDAICVTGALGGAAGGLALLKGDHTLDSEARRRLGRRLLRPEARLAEGVSLVGAGATSMIDISDGLVIDLERLMSASGTGCEVDPTALPIDGDLRDVPPVVPGFGIVRSALSGGEDFELLLTIAEDRIAEATAAIAPTPLKRIGVVTEGPMMVWDRTLERLKEELGWWDHLLKR